MKVLITGAGGFLGTAMTKFLSECDCEIFNLGSRAIENSKYFPLHNILDFDSIKKSLLEIRPDFLIHLAGSNITDSLLDSFRVNAFFSAQLLNVLTDLQLINHTKIFLSIGFFYLLLKILYFLILW